MNNKPIYLETELDSSFVSCPCCDEGLSTLKLDRAIKQIIHIAQGFQRAGTLPGKRIRMFIHSCARCPAYNKAVGSKPTSQHYFADKDNALVSAMDFHLEYYYKGLGWCRVPVPITYIIAECIPEFLNGGIGKYFNWNNPGLHVDMRGKKARWIVR